VYGMEEFETFWQITTVRDWDLEDARLEDATRQARAIVDASC
jgi:hypothetical protein